jgi:CelD/BcsL family acetyltransferase involved in cellulose biosynthesis
VTTQSHSHESRGQAPPSAAVPVPLLRSNTAIYEIDPLRDSRWTELTARHPQASVFHTSGWVRALQTTYGYEPVAFTTSAPSQELKNALLFCVVRSWLTGDRLVSLPFSDHCEPLVEDAEQFRSLCAHAESLRVSEGHKYVEIRSADSHLEFDKDFGSANTYTLHRLDLRPSLDALRKGFHRDCIQRKISRAERESLTYEAGHSPLLLQQFYGLLQLTRSRHHLPPQPFEWFQNLMACMGQDVSIRIASTGSRPIAAIMTLGHGKTMVYKYGGSDAQFSHLGATPMLFWRAIQDAKDAGMEELDLGRSDLDNPGLITFKKRWSAVGSTLTTWRAPATTASSSFDQVKGWLAKEGFARLPDSALTLAGRLLYRHIG